MHKSFVRFTVSILILMSIISCSEKKTETEPIIRPVRYQPVFVTGGDRVRTFTGVARSGIESKLSFKVGGTIKAINVKVGDNVKPGDVIATLDDSDYKLVVQEAEAALKQAEAQERAASSSYERIRGLYENRNASKNDLETARAQSESAKAMVQTAQKKLEQAQSQLSYTVLKAPIKSSVASVAVDPNENIGAGQMVTLLTSEGNTEVEVGLPEMLITQVREQDKVTVTFDAVPDKSFSARVTEVGVAATGVVTTYPVTVTLDEQSDQVRSGMAVQVAFQFHSGTGNEQIIVPSYAVSEDKTGTFVYTVIPEGDGLGTVKKTAVTAGELGEAGIEIKRGLQEGDLLITAGLTQLSDGMTVRIKEPGK